MYLKFSLKCEKLKNIFKSTTMKINLIRNCLEQLQLNFEINFFLNNSKLFYTKDNFKINILKNNHRFRNSFIIIIFENKSIFFSKIFL